MRISFGGKGIVPGSPATRSMAVEAAELIQNARVREEGGQARSLTRIDREKPNPGLSTKRAAAWS